jgi:hypothetical protein
MKYRFRVDDLVVCDSGKGIPCGELEIGRVYSIELKGCLSKLSGEYLGYKSPDGSSYGRFEFRRIALPAAGGDLVAPVPSVFQCILSVTDAAFGKRLFELVS